MEQTQQQQHPAQVLLRRREIRRSLIAWAQECGFEPALHHRLIISKLEAVSHGEVKRLMILVPPGSAKSTYASVLFPPWFLAQKPNNSILACSYSFTLVERFGKRCRNLIDDKKYVLGCSLAKDSAAAGDWATTSGSIYFAAGVGAGIAGHRADLGVIDDYLGSQEDADSKVIRDKQYEWYYNDFYPRLKPNAAQIIIANRRHEEDLVGRLLEEKSNKWDVIRLPMLAEDDKDPLGRKPGDRLWPEWYTEEMVTVAKTQPRMWATLYQQRPAPEDGDFFKQDWIVQYRPDDLPKNLRYYCGSDHAYRLNQENDRTCLLSAGVDDNERIWILPDWYWTRADAGMVVEAMLDLAQRRKPLCWWVGREAITGSIAPFLYKRMRERNVYVPIEELSESKDKMSKAQSIRARMSQKMVMFPSYAPNWDLALHELLTFPNSKHDDFVDALAKLGQGLDKMVKPATIPDPEKDIANYRWIPTVKNIRASHNRFARNQRAFELDK